jgi:integrase
MSVREFIEDVYKPFLETRVRKATRIGYEGKLDRHVVPKLGETKLSALEPYVLDRWRDELLEKMSGLSARHVYRAFSTALNRAVRWRFITSNPLLAVEPPSADVRDFETLSAKEVVSYLKTFRGHKLEPLIIVATSTGLRPCELYALTWSDVNLAEATVQVRRGLHERKSESWFEPPKSKRSSRTVSLPDWAVDALRPVRGIGPLVPGDGAEGHARPTEVARLYRKNLRIAKLRYVPIRDLRHTHATLLLEAGVDIVVVSRRLGHSTVAITDTHYLRPKRSADRKAADAFGELLALSGVGVSERDVDATK